MVLISTYWNVNIVCYNINVIKERVLISTYWNVNNKGLSCERNIMKRFNLNLLECK